MEHGRRTSWTGKQGPQHVSAHGASQILRVTPLLVSPAATSASRPPIGPKISSSSTLIGRTFRDRFLPFPVGLPRPVFGNGSTCNTPFLTGSAPQTEFAVTHSKQRTGKFLTGARMHIRIFEILQMSAQHLAALNPQSHAQFANFGTFLTETAQHSEIAVTHSKQTTGTFLTETRTASLAHRNSSNIDSKLLEGRAWLRQ
jgi:hypothetical protein